MVDQFLYSKQNNWDKMRTCELFIDKKWIDREHEYLSTAISTFSAKFGITTNRKYSESKSLLQQLSHEGWAVMYLCVRGIDYASFYDLMFCFGIVPTVWYF
jgi:hypothetical protein